MRTAFEQFVGVFAIARPFGRLGGDAEQLRRDQHALLVEHADSGVGQRRGVAGRPARELLDGVGAAGDHDAGVAG